MSVVLDNITSDSPITFSQAPTIFSMSANDNLQGVSNSYVNYIKDIAGFIPLNVANFINSSISFLATIKCPLISSGNGFISFVGSSLGIGRVGQTVTFMNANPFLSFLGVAMNDFPYIVSCSNSQCRICAGIGTLTDGTIVTLAPANQFSTLGIVVTCATFNGISASQSGSGTGFRYRGGNGITHFIMMGN
jgi:hypothetical protein